MRTFTLILLATLAMAMPACAQKVAQPRAATPASATTAIVAGNDQSELIHGLLDILNDAVITRLDAKVSLERASVQGATVRLEKLALRNLDIGVLLSARGAKRLAELVRKQGGTEANALTPLLEIARLGLFNRIEVSVRLRELSLRRLDVVADDLDVRGLLLQVGATPPDAHGNLRSDTLSQVLEILRHTALNKVRAHAGLDKLAAKRVRVQLDGLALQGLAVALILSRDEHDSPAEPAVTSLP